MITINFCAESLLGALCCCLPGAALCEVQHLVELYGYFQKRLVVKEKGGGGSYLTFHNDLIEMTDLFACLCDVTINYVCDITLHEHESQWAVHNVKRSVSNTEWTFLSLFVLIRVISF